jgi:hypothetical protein
MTSTSILAINQHMHNLIYVKDKPRNIHIKMPEQRVLTIAVLPHYFRSAAESVHMVCIV